MLTDLQVLTNLFNDPDYTVAELDALRDSADIEIDASQLFLNSTISQVKSLVFLTDPAFPVKEFTHSATRPSFIYTVATNTFAYTVRVEARNASGTLILETNRTIRIGPGGDLGPGGDTNWVPRLVAFLRITPATTNVIFNGTVQFTKDITGTVDPSVQWAVSDETIGTIDHNTGLFTAKDKPGDVVVVATSVADPNVSTNATVSVRGCFVSISPLTVSVPPRGRIRFQSATRGTGDGTAFWSVLGGGGTMDMNTGEFTAGNVEGTFKIKAETIDCGSATGMVRISQCAITNASICLPDGRVTGNGLVDLRFGSACGGVRKFFEFPYSLIDVTIDPLLQFCCGGITYVNTNPENTPAGSYSATLTVLNAFAPDEALTVTYVFTMHENRTSSISVSIGDCE